MGYVRSDEGDGVRIVLDGTLDALNASELRPLLDELVVDRKKSITLDLTRLRMIDSSGIGALVSLLKRVRAYGGDLQVAGLRDQPLAIFKLLQLERVFSQAPSR